VGARVSWQCMSLETGQPGVLFLCEPRDIYNKTKSKLSLVLPVILYFSILLRPRKISFLSNQLFIFIFYFYLILYDEVLQLEFHTGLMGKLSQD
jgi:hypothetical protein